MEIKKMYIDGKWHDSIAGNTREIIYPFNQQHIATTTEGNADDAALAISAARRAFDTGTWSKTPACERGALLEKTAQLIERDKDELAKLESLNTAKTMIESLEDMDSIISIIHYYAGLADKLGGEIIESPVPNSISRVVREPVGVCGQISPWNYPLLQVSWKMAPALAAGNTVIIKPSELTPLTSIKMIELTQEAGFPPGVINLVLGPGPSAGNELAAHHDVDLVSFTGGIETGKKIMRAAAANIKKITLELGGKNPNIIFNDADFETAVDYALNAVFFNAGQVCSAGARILVQDSIHDQFVEAVKTRAEKITLGDPFNETTQCGSLISAEHREKVAKYVTSGLQEGAKLILGGSAPTDPELKEGFFYLPTIFTGCTNNMRIVQEEIFGPVMTIERFSTEEQAIAWANSTIYGLSGAVWTINQNRAERVAAGLRMGTVWINDYNTYFAQAPWGGYKQSGIGRELGKAGLEEYTETKHIYQNIDTQPQNWFGRQH